MCKKPMSGSRLRARQAVSFLVVVAALLAGAGCGSSSAGSSSPGPDPEPNPGPHILGLRISPENVSLPLGGHQQFSASANYSDGRSRDVTSSVTWVSASPSVATISNAGLAVSRSVGSDTITASLDTTQASAAFSVTAAVITSIVVSPAVASIPRGVTQQFTATGSYSDGSQQDVTAHVQWRSSAPEIASVDASGLATGDNPGVASIAASYAGLADSGALTVSSAALVSLDIFPDSASIPAGRTEQYTAIGTYSDGSSADLTHTVAWASASPDVARINPSGLARGKSPGSDTITAALSGIGNSSALKVTSAVLVALTVTPPRVAVLFGKDQQFAATGTYSDNSQKDLTALVSWTSTSPQVASIGPTGLANSKDIGATSIDARHAGVDASADLHILPALQVNYFDNINRGLTQDAAVRLTHPGSPHRDLCAMIYVFDANQEITECCGCRTTPDGLRTLSVTHDLTSNPLTGVHSTTGTIKIVSADAQTNPRCDAGEITPKGTLRGWSTHIQTPDSATVAVTEGEFQDALLTPDEQANLQDICSRIEQLGSGHGICSCGEGD